MAEVLNDVFSSLMPEAGSAGPNLGVHSSSSSSAPSAALLVGEQRVGRALLLLTAVTAAARPRARVLFFTQTKIQEIPASVQRCVPNLGPEALKVPRPPLASLSPG